jgi:hypothetical protein
MKTRFGFHYVLLLMTLFLSLACEMINAVFNPGPLRVEAVEVTPAEGPGPFTASVALPAHTQVGTLSCYVPGEGEQASTSVYQQTVSPNKTSQIVTFPFSFAQPGSHRLYCTALEEGITGKTTFTVTAPNVGDPTATAGGPTVPAPPADETPLPSLEPTTPAPTPLQPLTF